MQIGEEFELIYQKLNSFYTPNEIALYLRSPQKLLDNEYPIDVLCRGETNRILDILQAMEDCVYL